MSNRLSLKLILLCALALMLPRAAMAMPAPDALWLNGSMYGANKWGLHNNTHPVRLTKDGDKFTRPAMSALTTEAIYASSLSTRLRAGAIANTTTSTMLSSPTARRSA